MSSIEENLSSSTSSSWLPLSSSESTTSSMSSSLESSSLSTVSTLSTSTISWSSSSWLPLSSSSPTSSSAATSTTSSISQNNHRRGPILPGEIRQLFSLPESIIYYIAMNPANAEVYKKLIRTCKYFYNQNPILVVNQLWFDITENGEGEWRYSMKNDIRDKGAIINMDEIQSKLWISYDFSVAPSLEDIAFRWPKNKKTYEKIHASIIPKIYRSDASRIHLISQVITFNDFVLLASNVEDLTTIWSKITENDGETEVMFEKIIEKLRKLHRIEWQFIDCRKCMSSNTVAELLKLQHFGNITYFELDDIHEIFNPRALFQAIKMKHKNLKINLHYLRISKEFKQQINEIVDDIISTKKLTYMAPEISY